LDGNFGFQEMVMVCCFENICTLLINFFVLSLPLLIVLEYAKIEALTFPLFYSLIYLAKIIASNKVFNQKDTLKKSKKRTFVENATTKEEYLIDENNGKLSIIKCIKQFRLDEYESRNWPMDSSKEGFDIRVKIEYCKLSIRIDGYIDVKDSLRCKFASFYLNMIKKSKHEKFSIIYDYLPSLDAKLIKHSKQNRTSTLLVAHSVIKTEKNNFEIITGINMENRQIIGSILLMPSKYGKRRVILIVYEKYIELKSLSIYKSKLLGNLININKD
jgi:hypothetical protein